MIISNQIRFVKNHQLYRIIVPARSRYRTIFHNDATQSFDLSKYVTGTFTGIKTTNQTVTVPFSFGVRVSGTTLSYWYRPNGGSWSELDSTTDPSISGTGHIFLGIDDTTGAATNFGGGTI